MIVLKTLKWSNAFSYGPNNSIDFSKDLLIQLIGKNGHGKSSVALILEEILYNKNSKNIKKGDILNRYADSSKYTIELSFSKDGDDYYIKTSRGSTQTVVLLKNGEDISSHTATGTYKQIEEILGFDHKTFTQIVYQSSSQSLEFLTATDTNRKKFLIDLLNLSIYTRAQEVFKELNKEVSLEVDSIEVKLRTVKDWLAKLEKEDLGQKQLMIVPSPPVDAVNKSIELAEKLKNIEHTNKRITQNNKYKEILKSIDITPVEDPNIDLNELTSRKLMLEAEISKNRKNITVIKTKCDVCGQPIDSSHKQHIVDTAKAEVDRLLPTLSQLEAELKEAGVKYSAYNKYKANVTEWERYHSLVDNTIQSVLLDRKEIEFELNHVNAIIEDVNKSIKKAQEYNNTASAHNAKVQVVLSQMSTMKEDLQKYSDLLLEAQKKQSNIQILVKTFSTTGLVAYKIECLVKDLENLANEYLVDMSDGRFQLSFKINSSDKLNVIITDNGHDIDILALSSGERARVNIATLLAIRKLMQNLSNSRINLLILDETIENLDIDGKEKLIEVLLKEEGLNTVLVSHSFTHPLINKLYIVKEDNISRIE